MQLYGVDLAAPTPTRTENHNYETVIIPHIRVSENQLDVLKATVNPLQQSDMYGMDIYEQAKLTLMRL